MTIPQAVVWIGLLAALLAAGGWCFEREPWQRPVSIARAIFFVAGVLFLLAALVLVSVYIVTRV